MGRRGRGGERYGTLSKEGWATHAINFSVIKSTLHDLDPFVFVSLAFALIFTYLCMRFDIEWNVHVAIVVSPLVFPLAFSINASYMVGKTSSGAEHRAGFH